MEGLLRLTLLPRRGAISPAAGGVRAGELPGTSGGILRGVLEPGTAGLRSSAQPHGRRRTVSVGWTRCAAMAVGR